MRYATLVPLVLAAAFGCRAKDARRDDTKAEGTSETDTATAMQASLVAVTSIAEIGIYEALALDLPPAVKAAGEEVAVDGSGKVLARRHGKRLRSREACSLRQRLRDPADALRRVASQYCFIEAASDAIPIGEKVHFTATGVRGPDPAKISVWVDEPKSGKLRVSTCLDNKLRTVIEVEPRGGRRSRGTFTLVDDGDVARFSSQGFFDNRVSNANRSFIATRSYMKPKNDSGGIAEHSALIVNPIGRSVLLNSSSGSFISPDTGAEVSFSLSGAAKVGEKLGTALVRYGDDGAYRAYFDGIGKVLPALNVRPLIVAAGLWIKPEELLPPIKASFRPNSFAVNAWDCSGTTEVTPPIHPEHIALCEPKPSFAAEDCDSAGYQLGRHERVDLEMAKGSVRTFGDVEKADTADTTVASEDDEGEEEAIGDGEPGDE